MAKKQNCVICFIVYIKAHDIYKDIAGNIGTRLNYEFYSSNYELDRPLPKEKNEKVIGLIKDELGKKVMTKFVGLKRKTYG